jgi:hypothetical protein
MAEQDDPRRDAGDYTTEEDAAQARRAAKDDAAARARQDPILFGPDPFEQQPGWTAPNGEPDDTETVTRRPSWPVIVGILVVVVVIVAALGIWVS